MRAPTKTSSSQGAPKKARTTGKGSSSSATKAEPCPYPGCKFNHPIEQCGLKKKHAQEKGWTWTKA